MSAKTSKRGIEIGVGSVFEQLGLPNAQERLRKARLMNVINDVIRRRGLSQKDVTVATGLNQADVSRLQHGRGARYSTDKLLHVLGNLGVDVEITQRIGSAGEAIVEVRELSRT